MKTLTEKKRTNWPFLYYTENEKMYFNPIEKRSEYEEANDVGEALL